MSGAGSTATLESLLMSRSLNDRELMQASGTAPDYAILPDASVLKIGGQSLMDRGRAAVYPIVEELAVLKRSRQLLIGTGGGTRARHVYSVAAELGLPTGVLTDAGAAVAGQNAKMLGYLMARYGVPTVGHEAFGALPLYIAECGAAIFPGMPPYDMWQHVPDEGVIPPYRTDAGCYLAAEVYGCRAMVFVKDEDGLYTANPKNDSKAKFIPEITVEELVALDLPDLIIERSMLGLMRHARHVKSVQVINGLKPGLISRALAGEHVGTIISVA
ncbi:MAG: amino acid kinase family protein [Pseudonocardiales bacterium]